MRRVLDPLLSPPSSCLDAGLRNESSRFHRIDEGIEVPLVLVGVRGGEVRDRLIEGIPLPRYDAIAMRSPQRACARARVAPQSRAYNVVSVTRSLSTSAPPFQSWSCRT